MMIRSKACLSFLALMLLFGNSSASFAEGFVIKPRLYLLAAGVSDYRDDYLDLAYAAKDAQDFSAAMKQHAGDVYRQVTVKTLLDPTSDDLLAGLDWLRREVTSKDIAVFFLAGHGVNDRWGDYYFLTKDVDTERLRRTAIEYHDIYRTLTNLPGTTLFFIDTCHADNVRGASQGVASVDPIAQGLIQSNSNMVVFASSTGNQFSLEDDAWGNGAFTKALVEGISGKADYTGDGLVTMNQLDLYVTERVKELTKNRQTPMTTKTVSMKDIAIGGR